VETLCYLLCLKLRSPDTVFLLRGNHETRAITQIYGFYDEVQRKYGNPMVWKYCCEVFDTMPLTINMNDRIMCVHGGLSPNLPTLDSTRELDRFGEPAGDGPMVDLMWSDPTEKIDGWALSNRGSGYLFGEKATKEFLHVNDL